MRFEFILHVVNGLYLGIPLRIYVGSNNTIDPVGSFVGLFLLHSHKVCNGGFHRYNRLYTLTAQTLASDFKQNEKMLRSVIKSFKPPAPVV